MLTLTLILTLTLTQVSFITVQFSGSIVGQSWLEAQFLSPSLNRPQEEFPTPFRANQLMAMLARILRAKHLKNRKFSPTSLYRQA